MSNLSNRRILIVDDESDLTEALAIRLSLGWGFTVAVAHDGEEGLRKTSVFRPDLILLDLAMPVVDGWEMCRRLRDDPGTRDIPIVIMTAWSTDDLHKRAMEEGVSEVLLKPADDDQLLSILREVTGTTRPPEAAHAGSRRPERRQPERRRQPRPKPTDRRHR